MLRPLFSRLVPITVALLVVLVVTAGMNRFFTTGTGPNPSDDLDDLDTPYQECANGFREGAREAGITFRMAFLPGEQGENFKINLYDHGCGVVIGDYDNDGHDDVYFLNQLGPNVLYRNKGDGTFEDVTEKAGVGLGDRVC